LRSLFQKDDNDNELLIAAVSRTFTKTETKYSTHKKEALALHYTLRSMDFYIRYADNLTIYVDCRALLYIRIAREQQDILLRFSIELSKYDATMIHVPGVLNEISDMLSRQHKDIDDIEDILSQRQTISEKDTLKIIDALTIPENFTLTKSQLFNLLTGPSPRDDTNKRAPPKSKAKEGIKNVKNIPTTLNNRKKKCQEPQKS